MTDEHTATVRCQLGTWRSGAESPSFPGASDASRLLRSVQPAVGGDGCTLVRVRLATSDEETLLEVRDRLLGQEPIVATSIGREIGPGAPGTFDIVVVPGRDAATVGRAVASADDVVGVAATSFDTEPQDAPGDRGLHGSGSVGDVLASSPQSDEAGGAVRGEVDHASSVDPLGRSRDGARDARRATRNGSGDLEVLEGAPDIGGLAALEDGDGDASGASPMSTLDSSEPATRNGPPRPHANGGAPHATDGSPPAETNDTGTDRIEDLEARVTALEARLERGCDTEAGDDRERLAERVDVLEAAVADLERWRRRTLAAVLEEPP